SPAATFANKPFKVEPASLALCIQAAVRDEAEVAVIFPAGYGQISLISRPHVQVKVEPAAGAEGAGDHAKGAPEVAFARQVIEGIELATDQVHQLRQAEAAQIGAEYADGHNCLLGFPARLAAH